MAVSLLALAHASELEVWRDSTFQQGMSHPERVAESFYAMLFSGLALLLMLWAILPRLPGWIPLGAFAVTLLVIAIHYMGWLAKFDKYGTDSAAAIPYAARLLLEGKNPYEAFVLADAVQYFDLPPEYVTRLADGTVWTSFIYPAASFLSVLPIVALGSDEVRPLYVVFSMVIVLLISWSAPKAYKVPTMSFLLMHHLLNSHSVAGGLPEPLWALPVLASWYMRDKPLVAAGLLGYAASVKQLGAFFVPFYIAYLLRTQGVRSAATALATSAGIFLAFNLPFFIGAPTAWMESVIGVTMAPLPTLGVGPALFVHEAWPDLSYRVFTVAGVAALGGAFLWYLLSARAPLYLAWIIPLLPLWFAWRSLSSYFYLLPLFALAVFLSLAREAEKNAVPPPTTEPEAPQTAAV